MDVVLEVEEALPAFMTLERTQIVLDGASVNKGSFPIKLKLTDEKGSSQSYSFSITITEPAVGIVIDAPIVSNEIITKPKVITSNFKPPEEVIQKKLTAKIESISALGEMKVKFNMDMVTTFNHSIINQTSTPMILITSDGRERNTGFNKSNLGFVWNATDFVKDTLSIKINFTNAIQISPNQDQDEIQINLTDVAMYLNSKSRIAFDKDFWILKSKLRRQLQDSATMRTFAASSEGAADSMKGVLIMSFVLNIVLSGVMSYMVSWLNSLQMIIHLPMLRYMFPANVSSLYSLIMPVVTFDIIDPEWSTMLLFEFDEPKQEQLKSTVFD